MNEVSNLPVIHLVKDSENFEDGNDMNAFCLDVYEEHLQESCNDIKELDVENIYRAFELLQEEQEGY